MCTENYELAQQEAVLFAKQHLAPAAQNIERQQFIVPDIISCVAQAGYLGASIPQKIWRTRLRFLSTVRFA